jgi:hypothetical protein
MFGTPRRRVCMRFEFDQIMVLPVRLYSIAGIEVPILELVSPQASAIGTCDRAHSNVG